MPNRYSASSLLFLLLLLPLLAAAAPAGEVTHISGVAMVRKPDGSSHIIAARTPVEQGDVVVTSAKTFARIKFTDGGEITLRPESQLRIETYAFEQDKPQEDAFIFSLLKGGLRTITGLVGKRRERSYELRTHTSTIGVRGTGYTALLCQGDCADLRTVSGEVPPDGLHLEIFEGSIIVSNTAGTLLLSSGDFGYVRDSSVAPINVPRADAVLFPIFQFNQPRGSGLDRSCIIP
jgi:FecR protein